jgi:methyl-accepting chemotaxis protein
MQSLRPVSPAVEGQKPQVLRRAAPVTRSVPLEEPSVTGTMTTAGQRDDLGVRRFGRVMRTVGIVGVLSGVIAAAIGLWLLRDLDVLLERSLGLTAESLTTVDSSLSVATDSVAVVGDGLGDAESTSRGLKGTLDEGADLLGQTSSLLRGDVAASIESLSESLPTIIQVGGTIDTTLQALDELPVGPTYEPQEPFDETLQALSENLEGLPADLRRQATTIDSAGDNLRDVGAQGEEVATAIADVRTTLDEANEVLSQYEATASEARTLIDNTTADLGRRLNVLRALVILLGAVYCASQGLLLYMGHRLARSSVTVVTGGD